MFISQREILKNKKEFNEKLKLKNKNPQGIRVNHGILKFFHECYCSW